MPVHYYGITFNHRSRNQEAFHPGYRRVAGPNSIALVLVTNGSSSEQGTTAKVLQYADVTKTVYNPTSYLIRNVRSNGNIAILGNAVLHTSMLRLE